jgi:hypothetical protein
MSWRQDAFDMSDSGDQKLRTERAEPAVEHPPKTGTLGWALLVIVALPLSLALLAAFMKYWRQ